MIQQYSKRTNLSMKIIITSKKQLRLINEATTSIMLTDSNICTLRDLAQYDQISTIKLGYWYGAVEPNDFLLFKNLQSLNLTNCNLRDIDYNVLYNISNLTSLNVVQPPSNWKVPPTVTKLCIRKLTEPIELTSNLRSFTLHQGNVKCDNLHNLFDLSKLTRLTKLCIETGFLDSAIVDQIPLGVTKLSLFDLSNLTNLNQFVNLVNLR